METLFTQDATNVEILRISSTRMIVLPYVAWPEAVIGVLFGLGIQLYFHLLLELNLSSVAMACHLSLAGLDL